jgi:hypothetical protein
MVDYVKEEASSWELGRVFRTFKFDTIVRATYSQLTNDAGATMQELEQLHEFKIQWEFLHLKSDPITRYRTRCALFCDQPQ